MARRRRFPPAGGSPPERTRWLLGTISALAGVVMLAVFLAGGVLWLTLPASNQTLTIPGLTAAAGITLDGNGVPRIRAASEHDAFVALGFIHARDRMFQMELMRRAASGRLSELIGPAALGYDKYMRVLGLARLAEDDVAAQSPETKAALAAYASGVNAWIADRGRFASLESLVFGKPEPWRPADSLMWSRAMGLMLSGNYRTELARQALRGKIPPDLLEGLWPMPPAPRRPEASASGAAARTLLGLLPAFPDPFTQPNRASNAWAVDGRQSGTGAPLLAGDPHLGFGFPGLWYLARITYPGHVLAGATAPGVPFLVIGRDSQIAWTFTTTGADTQDVFLEPDGAPVITREERIKVRGAPDVILTVRTTRHGPVISDLSAAEGPMMAVAMANLRPNDTSATGLLALNHAASVEDAGKAAALIQSSVQNLMTADRTKIALFVTGRVPIRRGGDGWAPVPGTATAIAPEDVRPPGAEPGIDIAAPAARVDQAKPGDDAWGWTGFASGESLPHVVGPASGRLVNANEPVAPPDFPVFMGRDSFRDWRARRIRALLDLTPVHTASDFAAMQVDVVSPYAVALLPLLRGVPGAASLLRDWDGKMVSDASQPLVFTAWMLAFRDEVLARSGLTASEAAGAMPPVFDFVPFVLSPAGTFWCHGDCAPLLKISLDRTISSLGARFGPDPAAWEWGDAHQAVFAHPMLRDIPLLGALTTIRIAMPGDGTTLGRADMNTALDAIHGASYRGVYDLADLDRSLFMVAPGQSGHPLSGHARDFLTRWRDGAMILLGPDAVSVTGRIRLEP